MSAYHVTALVLGGVYYYGFIWGFYLLGSAISPLFKYVQPDPGSMAAMIAINMIIALFGALVPAIIFAVAIDRILRPSTKLFLLGSSLSYAAFSIWSIADNYSGDDSVLGLHYLYIDSGKMISGLVGLLIVCVIYLKIRSNKDDHQEAEDVVEAHS